MSAILGIDTSCYTTSCALIDTESKVVADVRRVLNVPMGECGIRQSDAVFAHLRVLPQIISELMKAAGQQDLVAVCASDKPRDDKDSYLPVFQAGVSFAGAIASISRIPCFFTTHQRGHIEAAQIGQPPLQKEHLAIHLSGGTTELILVCKGSIQRIAGTGDISAGQLLDRIGVLLGFPFPAGAEVEKLAQQGRAEGRYPSAIRDTELHFSGAEAAAKRDIQTKSIKKEQVAAELFDFISRSLVKLSIVSSQLTGLKEILVTGGVASSSLLRQSLMRRVERRGLPLAFHFGETKYASDNAAGVALIGFHQYQAFKEDIYGYCAKWQGTV